MKFWKTCRRNRGKANSAHKIVIQEKKEVYLRASMFLSKLRTIELKERK